MAAALGRARSRLDLSKRDWVGWGGGAGGPAAEAPQGEMEREVRGGQRRSEEVRRSGCDEVGGPPSARGQAKGGRLGRPGLGRLERGE